MTRATGQSGFTLVEMLVGIVITLLVFGTVLTIFETFLRDTNTDTLRNEAQDAARTAIDRMSRQLRNVAAPTAGSAGALELAGPYGVVFQTVNAGAPPVGSQNATNQMRVRYCVNDTNPSNESLYLQTQNWSSASAPAIPSTSTCPGPTTGSPPVWTTSQLLLANVTNESHGQDRPMFIYDPLGETSPQQINGVEVNLYVDPNPVAYPGETDITSAIYLRNGLVPPVANFVVSEPNGHMQLNASAAYDPNGQALSYQWYQGGTCPTPTGAISGATTQFYDAGTNFTHGQSYTFTLVVTDTAGLSNCASQTVTAL
jgi:prepilin-type N-terminal cleavage/methylation domain-containing protein